MKKGALMLIFSRVEIEFMENDFLFFHLFIQWTWNNVLGLGSMMTSEKKEYNHRELTLCRILSKKKDPYIIFYVYEDIDNRVFHEV